jgi:hypothetical protein
VFEESLVNQELHDIEQLHPVFAGSPEQALCLAEGVLERDYTEGLAEVEARNVKIFPVPQPFSNGKQYIVRDAAHNTSSGTFRNPQPGGLNTVACPATSQNI